MWICSVINHWLFKALSDNNIYLTVYICKPQLIGQRLLFQLPYIQSVFTRLKSWWTYVVWSSQISYLQATQREMASVLISDLYGKHLSQDDIAQGKLVVSTITCVRCSWRLMRRRQYWNKGSDTPLEKEMKFYKSQMHCVSCGDHKWKCLTIIFYSDLLVLLFWYWVLGHIGNSLSSWQVLNMKHLVQSLLKWHKKVFRQGKKL